jgi:hypothetical protein
MLFPLPVVLRLWGKDNGKEVKSQKGKGERGKVRIVNIESKRKIQQRP